MTIACLFFYYTVTDLVLNLVLSCAVTPTQLGDAWVSEVNLYLVCTKRQEGCRQKKGKEK